MVLLICSLSAAALSVTPLAHAQVTYSVSKEWMKAWINPDTSVDILYNITFSYLSGSPQGVFDVGMPKTGFQVHYVEDASGSALTYQDISSGGYVGIEVSLKKPNVLNQPYTFLVYASVPGLIYQDSMNPGNAGMQLYPSTFQSATGTEDLRVEFELPSGVMTSEVKSPANLSFDNVFTDLSDQNRTVVFWERTSWSPDQAFLAGVSFPENYLAITPFPSSSFTTGPFPTPYQGGGFSGGDFAIFGGVAFVIVIIFVLAVVAGVAKSAYEAPRVSVEALGANRSLTAVEAGLVLGLKPVRVLTMMLYGLLLKHLVAVVESEPLLKLKKIEKPNDESTSANGAASPSPRYYEIDFLNSIKPDGTLDEKLLALSYQGLVNTVNRKLSGYSRQDTMNYYKSIVDKAWLQVTQAGTADIMGDALEKNLEWLLTDDHFDDRFKTAFPPNIIIMPSPAWWWYWGGPHVPGTTQTVGQQQSRTPIVQPSPTTPAPTLPGKPVPLPGQDFANNIVRNIQGASNNMVRNIQDFANKLVPFGQVPAKGTNPVSGKPSCVCACHACACACACVSCACACAGGGAR
jgi:hypothetical protein